MRLQRQALGLTQALFRAVMITGVYQRGELHEIAERNRRFGQPRMATLMHRRYVVNHKRVERLWKEECLQLPRSQPLKKRTGLEWIRPQEAKAPNEVWCSDFVHDRTEYGQKLKMLTVIGEYTRD